MSYIGKIKLSLYNAVDGFSIKTSPEQVSDRFRANGNNYVCYLSSAFPDGVENITVEFSSSEWNTGKCISIEADEINGEWEGKNIGTIDSYSKVLRIEKVDIQTYKIYIKDNSLAGPQSENGHDEEVYDDDTDELRIPTSLRLDLIDELEAELAERVKADMELVKNYREKPAEQTALEKELERIYNGIIRKEFIVDDDFVREVLKCEKELSEKMSASKKNNNVEE